MPYLSQLKTPHEFRQNKEGLSVDRYERARNVRHDMIRELVIEHRRIDILAQYVLRGPKDDEPLWFHLDMMSWQDQNPEGLILAFRGARKTSYLTIARSILEIICNPNIRILLVSDALDQAKSFLRAIKSHFENNEEFKSIFGNYYIGSEKWTDSEIIVTKRTAIGLKEATITCAGMETAMLGRHFDIIIGDDLVTNDNSLTEGLREKAKNFFYRTLIHTLDPDGKFWILGTRWSEDDLYGHLEKEDFRGKVYRLGILDELTDQSIWEEKFSTERMHRLRRGNLAAFELQMLCSSGVSLGGIFNDSHFDLYEDLPKSYFKWQAVDLAIGQKARNDYFAHVTIAVEKLTKRIYLIDYNETKIPFERQVELINAKFRRHIDTVRVGVEANAYQVALVQVIKSTYKDIPVVPRYTSKDKEARAQQLSWMAADHGSFMIRREHDHFKRRLCAFPNGPKDLFDAFDLAVGMSMKGVRKRRKKEPGLL